MYENWIFSGMSRKWFASFLNVNSSRITKENFPSSLTSVKCKIFSWKITKEIFISRAKKASFIVAEFPALKYLNIFFLKHIKIDHMKESQVQRCRLENDFLLRKFKVHETSRTFFLVPSLSSSTLNVNHVCEIVFLINTWVRKAIIRSRVQGPFLC